MGERTEQNLFAAFVGEAKAHFRLRAFARKADQEGYAEVARLFRAIAHAEGIHAEAHLRRLGDAVVKGTEENLQRSFESEATVNAVTYPDFIRQAEEEGDRASARLFTMARDVEASHRELYKRAMECVLDERDCAYYVCRVCGYVAKTVPDDGCPVCSAKKDVWTLIE